jgi:hypothetical protein
MLMMEDSPRSQQGYFPQLLHRIAAGELMPWPTGAGGNEHYLSDDLATAGKALSPSALKAITVTV